MLLLPPQPRVPRTSENRPPPLLLGAPNAQNMGANSFSLLAAASGFLASYFNSKLVEERKARIERVNEQLREFVGPLLATVATSHSAWAAMVAQSGQTGSRAFQDAVTADPAGPEAEAYRAWMTSVLQPLNEKGACMT